MVVEDDRLTRRSLELHLTQAGYVCQTTHSICAGLALARTRVPDLLLLDIGLPGVDGLEGLRIFQSHYPELPVIFLTARRRELDEIIGLEIGADDYITKPFDIDVLLAHIKAVLRRTSPPIANTNFTTPSTLVVGDLTIDPVGHVVALGAASDKRHIDLTPKEFDLLFYLAQNIGAAVSVQDILQHVWGEDWIGEEQTVYVHIRWLRTKLEDEPNRPQRLITIHRTGYKLVAKT